MDFGIFPLILWVKQSDAGNITVCPFHDLGEQMSSVLYLQIKYVLVVQHILFICSLEVTVFIYLQMTSKCVYSLTGPAYKGSYSIA